MPLPHTVHRATLCLLALGAGWQLVAWIGAPGGWLWRIAALLLAAAGAAAVRRPPPNAPGPAEWGPAESGPAGSGPAGSGPASPGFAAWTAVLLIVLGALEWRLERGELLARGALTFAAALLVGGCLLTRLGARSDQPATRLGERLPLALAVAACSLLALEAGARAARGLHTYDPVSDRPRHGPALFRDEHRSARANPGYRGHQVHREFDGVRVEINALGLRDGLDEAVAPQPGIPVVLCLGDSFTYGLGVALEDTFQERLETLLGQPAPRVFGAGIPGFGTRDARRQLSEVASHARPDLVVLALFEGNDFQDTASARARGELPPPTPAGSVQPPEGPAPLRAFLARLRTEAFWRETSALLQIGSSRGTGLPSQFMLEALGGDPLGRVAPMVEGQFDELALLRGEVEDLGAELFVLLVPSALQAEPARLDRFRGDRADRAGLDRRAFHDDLGARLRREGYRVADPMALLEAGAEQGLSGYHIEGHWNAAGHAAAARTLAPLLRDALGVD